MLAFNEYSPVDVYNTRNYKNRIRIRNVVILEILGMKSTLNYNFVL